MPTIEEYRESDIKDDDGSAESDMAATMRKGDAGPAYGGTTAYGGGEDMGTMVAHGTSKRQDAGAGAGAQPGFMNYFRKEEKEAAAPAPSSSDFRTGKQLEVSADSTLIELRKMLIDVNRAHEKEILAVDQYYEERKRQLRQLIEQKKRNKS